MAANPVIEKRNLLTVFGLVNPETLLVRVAISGEVQVTADDANGMPVNVLLQPADPTIGSRQYNLLDYAPIGSWKVSSTLMRAVTNGWLYVDTPASNAPSPIVIEEPDCCDLAILKPPDAELGDIMVYDGSDWVRLPVSGTAGSVLTSNGVGAQPTYQVSLADGYHTVEDDGVAITQRNTLNFVGDTFTVADVSSKTRVTANDFSATTRGVVPASGGGTTNFLRADGTWASAGVSDHGALSGLGDDDHTQYLLVDGTRATTGAFTVGGAGTLILAEGVAPSNTAGFGKIYVKSSDNKLYFKNAGGSEFDLTVSGTLTGTGAAPVVDGAYTYYRIPYWTSSSNLASDAAFTIGISSGDEQYITVGDPDFSTAYTSINRYPGTDPGTYIAEVSAGTDDTQGYATLKLISTISSKFTYLTQYSGAYGVSLMGTTLNSSFAIEADGAEALFVHTASAKPIIIGAGTTEVVRLINSGAGFIFNEGAADIDARFESAAAAARPNLWTLDAGLGRVGINRALAAHGATFDIDNLAVAEPVFIARDNGTAVFTIADGGDTTIAPVAGHASHALTITGGALSADTSALTATATLNASASAQYGLQATVTGAGAGAGSQTGFFVNLVAGYTGTSATRAGYFNNANLNGGGTTAISDTGNANYGVSGLSIVTNNTDRSAVGVFGYGAQAGNAGATARSFGILGLADGGGVANTVSLGVYGTARKSTTEIAVGGMFSLYGETDTIGTLANAALIADNGSVAAPIFLARDNGTTVFTIDDGGNVGIGITPTSLFHVSGTAPTSGGNPLANVVVATGGSDANGRRGMNVTFSAGYTGSGGTEAFQGLNVVAGTNTSLLDLDTFGGGNVGVRGVTQVTTAGDNIGLLGIASQSTRLNVGLAGKVIVDADTGVGIGVAGLAAPGLVEGTPHKIGVFAGIRAPNTPGSGAFSVPNVSAALVADNGNSTQAIAIFRDNSTTIMTIADGGNVSMTGSLSVDGNTTLGNAAGDTLTITGTAVTTPNGLNFDANTFVIDAANNRIGVGNPSPSYLIDALEAVNGPSLIRVKNSSNGAAASPQMSMENDVSNALQAGIRSSGYVDGSFNGFAAGEAFVVGNATDLVLSTFGDTEHVRIQRRKTGTVDATGVVELLRATTTELVVNQGEVDVDFRVASKDLNKALFVDGNDNTVLFLNDKVLISSDGVDLLNIAAPGNPAAGYGRLYADSGDKKLYWKDDVGTTYDLTNGSITGSGAANRIAYWSGASTLTSSAGLQYDGTDVTLTGSATGYNFNAIRSTNGNIGYFSQNDTAGTAATSRAWVIADGVAANSVQGSLWAISASYTDAFWGSYSAGKVLLASRGSTTRSDLMIGVLGAGTGGKIAFHVGGNNEAPLATNEKMAISSTTITFNSATSDTNTFLGSLLIADGTETNPSVRFSSDNDGTGTGIYRSAANTLAISNNGSRRFQVGTNVISFGVHLFENGSAALPSQAYSSDANTGMYRSTEDILGFSAGGVERALIGASETVFNGPGNVVNFRIASDTDQNMLVVDADALTGSLGAVGIGTAAPQRDLHVLRTVAAGGVTAQAENAAGDGAGQLIAQAPNVQAAVVSYGATFAGSTFGVTNAGKAGLLASGTSLTGLLVGTLTSDAITFGTNNTAAMTINTSQQVILNQANSLGIGAAPGEYLDITAVGAGSRGGRVTNSTTTGSSKWELSAANNVNAIFQAFGTGSVGLSNFGTVNDGCTVLLGSGAGLTGMKIGTVTSDSLLFGTNDTLAVTINTSQQMGVGISPVSRVDVGGSFGAAITSVSADTTLDATHFTVEVDASGANRTITLPAAAGCTRRMYVVKKTDSSANTVTLDANGGELIDGATTQVISAQYASLWIQSNGTGWVIL